MKYRIVEVQETNGTKTWRVQKKSLFFWSNVEHYVTSEFGHMTWTAVFWSLESAQEKIKKLQSKNSVKRTEKVVATYDDIH